MNHVYFIRPRGWDGPIKIGCTHRLQDRFGAINNWSPVPLEVVATIPGHRELERRFHLRFWHLRDRGEWFKAAPELDATIEEVRAGTFDVASLPHFGVRKGWQGARAPETTKAIVYSIRLGRLAKRGVPIPAEVAAARNTYVDDPIEKARRRAVIAEFVDRYRAEAA
jgi:hypothetical protein